jgi:hypothetical protein
MRSTVRRILIVGVTFSLSIACAHAGPCSNEIARTEDVMRDPGPTTGPTNPQSTARRHIADTEQPPCA